MINNFNNNNHKIYKQIMILDILQNNWRIYSKNNYCKTVLLVIKLAIINLKIKIIIYNMSHY